MNIFLSPFAPENLFIPTGDDSSLLVHYCCKVVIHLPSRDRVSIPPINILHPLSRNATCSTFVVFNTDTVLCCVPRECHIITPLVDRSCSSTYTIGSLKENVALYPSRSVTSRCFNHLSRRIDRFANTQSLLSSSRFEQRKTVSLRARIARRFGRRHRSALQTANLASSSSNTLHMSSTDDKRPAVFCYSIVVCIIVL